MAAQKVCLHVLDEQAGKPSPQDDARQSDIRNSAYCRFVNKMVASHPTTLLDAIQATSDSDSVALICVERGRQITYRELIAQVLQVLLSPQTITFNLVTFMTMSSSIWSHVVVHIIPTGCFRASRCWHRSWRGCQHRGDKHGENLDNVG